MDFRRIFFVLTAIFLSLPATKAQEVSIWSKYEIDFTSSKDFENVLYQLKDFHADFISPTGRQISINGFWNGGNNFKIRFSPDELGRWTYRTVCSDTLNPGLHHQTGTFNCIKNNNDFDIYQRGTIVRSPGNYHLTYADGTPFFYVACTAWNGALKSTDTEWSEYLTQRKNNNYNVIQFVTTQWRGGSTDRNGEVAFTGSGKIEINPRFFQRLDEKIDAINAHGLVAAPVLLWALQKGDGRHFSPGYYLPDEEAILLAKYIVARYGGNQVIWILGGDGKYIDEYEQRWKRIGREVFGDPHPGIVAQHPQGLSWIGEDYIGENWLDIVGYQSSHSNREYTVNWINKGPASAQWSNLPARPLINLEPNYEEIHFSISDTDVRNASYWSIFATPPSGITYGANGIWPWIQYEGELIENHRNPEGRGPSTWKESIAFPGSLQIGYLAGFINQFEWWNLKPGQDLLIKQPGDEVYNHFVSVLADDQLSTILAYTPIQQEIQIRNMAGYTYQVIWFDPVHNKFVPGAEVNATQINLSPQTNQDWVAILTKK